MYRDHQGLLDSLSKKSGLKVDLQLFADYGSMVRGIREGGLELAWLGPLAYVEAENALRGNPKLRIIPIVKPVRRGQSQYYSEIIVRKDSGIDTVADLAGKKLACVDTESTAGYLLAAAHLVRAGIPVNDPLLAHPHFLHQYGNVVLAVLFGKFDAGAVFEGAPKLFLKDRDEIRRDEIRVLARSEPVPYEPITAIVGGAMSEAGAAEIQKSFLELNADTEILKKLQVSGFVEATQEEYNPIRKIVETVRRISADRTAKADVQ